MLLKDKFKSQFFLVISFVFSLALIGITAGFKIINPKNTSWLEAGDGIAEISWEFFRRQPLFQFPLGLNPNYGLEISSTMAFDGQIPLLSLIFHPFSDILPERFQYYGIFIFLSFALNFLFSTKIFREFKMNNSQIIINSFFLSLSPIILNRYIENTHYALTAAWIIFWAILLTLRNDNSVLKWLSIFILIVLIHFYYVVFVLAIYSIHNIYSALKKKIKLQQIIINSLIILIACLLIMYIVGYFYGGVSSTDIGYGLFRSTLTSLFDPSGWSILLPDLKELEGTYEGFSYLGFPSLMLFAIFIVLLVLQKKPKDFIKYNFSTLFVGAILLFIFSLSNKIAIGTQELFTFPVPQFLNTFTNTFRSTGRFTWLLVFIILIYSTYQVFLRLKSKTYTVILVLILILNIFDISKQLLSERNKKFNSIYENNLTSAAWQELNQCYDFLRVYPPVAGVDNVYNFLNIANKQKMGVNTARLGRFSQDSLNNAFLTVHEQFQNGTLSNDSFYVFSGSTFVANDVVDYKKNMALKLIDENTGWGEINGFTFIAPNLKNCAGGEEIKAISNKYGPLESSIYKGGVLRFGIGQNSDNYILTAFSQLFDWGVETQDELSNITLNMSSDLNPKVLKLQGKPADNSLSSINLNIEINSEYVDKCEFNIYESLCEIDISKNLLKNNIINIKFKPNKNNASTEFPKLGLISLEIT